MVVVADVGMLSAANLNALEEADRAEPLKKQRFVEVIGQNVTSDEAPSERSRQAAGHQAYVSNIYPAVMDGPRPVEGRSVRPDGQVRS